MSTSSIRERPTSHYQNEKSSVTESSSSSGHQKHDSEQIEHVEDGGTAVDSSTSSSENVKFYPNQWSRYRSFLREPAAEFFGTMMIIIFGNGVNCQVTLTGSTAVRAAAAGDYFSINFGWAIGTALGVWFSGGVSGGHLNPAVTLALATFRDFPWRKVPTFILAQILGAMCGAAIIYGNYYHAITLYEGGPHIRTIAGPTATAGLFSTYAVDFIPSVTCFFDEFLGTAMLLFVVCSINDKKNGPPPAGLNPLVLFLTVLGIGASLGFQTAYAINPARDLGPRLMTYMVGYGRPVWDYRNQYWLWCAILGPVTGAMAGVGVYDMFIFEGEESILNRPNAAARKRNLKGPSEEKHKAPAGADQV